MTIFLIHLFFTLFNTGLIWTIQLVHYPLFLKVGPDHFVDYEQDHTTKISYLVIPSMITELATGILLAASQGISSIYGLLLLLLSLVWVSTFLLQVPLHNALNHAYDAKKIQRLVNTNWIRTLAWTLRSLILLGILNAIIQ